MMARTKIREITLIDSKGAFSLFKKQTPIKEYDFESLSVIRKLLSNQRAKILYTIKYENPSSVYDLAKKLGRNFKSVYEDLKLLERLGFVEFIQEKTKNRIRHKPELVIDTLTIHFKI